MKQLSSGNKIVTILLLNAVMHTNKSD